MKRIYECTTCGYLYDEGCGDPDSDIDAGTEFDDLPRTWICPICSAPKSEFELTDSSDDEDT